MSNDYYNPTGNPANRSSGSSALIRTEFTNVQSAFDKQNALSGNGYKLVVVNSGGAANTVVSWKIYGGANDTLSSAYGLNALALAVAGADQNTAFGAYAMSNGVVTGDNNVAVGYKALYINTSGIANIAIGAGALQANTTGNSNIAIGDGAIGQCAAGFNNTAVGAAAMNDRTSGNYNTGIGSQALYHNATGSNNTALGFYAGFSYTGSGITAVGYQAATATTGTGVTAVGYNSLLANTTGADSTAVGYGALVAQTNTGYNTAVGTSALNGITTGSFMDALGWHAGYAAGSASTQCVFIGASAGVDLAGANISGCAFLGVTSGNGATGGNSNTFLGCSSGMSGGPYSGSTAVGNSATITASNQQVFGTSAITSYYFPGTAAYLKFAGGASTAAPITVTAATYTVDSGSIATQIDSSIIANRAGTVTLGLPAAASYAGRWLYIRTIQAQTVVSNSSNVVPSAGGAAGTAILAATAGKWAALQSDGTNWQVMMAN